MSYITPLPTTLTRLFCLALCLGTAQTHTMARVDNSIRKVAHETPDTTNGAAKRTQLHSGYQSPLAVVTEAAPETEEEERTQLHSGYQNPLAVVTEAAPETEEEHTPISNIFQKLRKQLSQKPPRTKPKTQTAQTPDPYTRMAEEHRKYLESIQKQLDTEEQLVEGIDDYHLSLK